MEVMLMHSLAKLPRRASAGAAGYDLTSTETVSIFPGTRGVVSTGVSVKLPPGVYGRVAPRSGLAVKDGIQVGAGVIDADYRGEIKVLLFNHSNDHVFNVSPGDRVAQLICERCELPEVIQVDELDETERGEGKFGSTGR